MSQMTDEEQSQPIDKLEQAKTQKKPKKKYEPLEFYIKDSYIDAKDSVNSWCLAQIIERCNDDSTLRLNFDGWSHKWDEWVRFSSTKIAPFRRYSQGYTGQNKFAIRDWRFNLEELKSKIARYHEYINTSFQCLSTPNDITQNLRGVDYVYIDAILQNEYKNPSEEIPYVFEFLKLHLRLYIKFLEILPDYFGDYLEGFANPESFLINERIALAHSIYELTDSVNKIFGSSQRCWNYFKRYDSNEYDTSFAKTKNYSGQDFDENYLGQDNNDDDMDNNKQQIKLSHLITSFINYFGENYGFKAWIKVFTHKITQQKEYTPFKIMNILLSIIETIYPYLNKDLINKLMPLIKAAIIERLKYINDKEIKELDKDLLNKFFTRIQDLFGQYYDNQEIYQLTEIAELEIALKFLICPYFEKRLKGINEIKDITEKIDAHENFLNHNGQIPIGNNNNNQQYKITKYLNAKIFINWIFQNKVFELILGDSLHIEIVKRCHDILKFIAKFESIPVQLIDLLWNACEGKHEAIVRVIYETIIEIAGYLTDEAVKRLNSKIEAIPNEQHSELTLNLIKNWAINTLPKLNDIYNDDYNTPSTSSTATTVNDVKSKITSTSSSSLQNTNDEWNIDLDESKFYCTGLLWKLMQDAANVSTQISEQALNSLVIVLRESQCLKLRKLYLYRSFDNIKKGESVSQSINLIHSILHSHYFNNQNSLNQVLKELDDIFDLVQIMINNMKKYHTQIKDILRSKASSSSGSIIIIEEDREKAYIGKYSYNINFNNRFVFLEYLVSNHGYELYLDDNQIETLWDLYVINSIFEQDKILFFKWISKKSDLSRFNESTYIIKKDHVPFFFDNILCNYKKFDFINMIPEGFECFSFYFKLINEINDKFKIIKGSKFIVIDMNFHGKDALWNIFLNCKNPQTIEASINLLVECHLKLSPLLNDKKKDIMEIFTMKCMNLLKEASEKQNQRLVTKAVMLLMNFFDKFEGKTKPEARSDNYRYIHQITINTILKPDNQVRYIQMGFQQSLGLFKRKICEAYGLAMNEFKIYIKSMPLEIDDDDTSLNQIISSGPIIIQRINPKLLEGNEYHPKHIIAENSVYINLLFDLLLDDNNENMNDIWDLLTRLPINEKIKNSLYNIEDKWEILLSTNSIYKLLYCLQIIEEFTYDKDKVNNLSITSGANEHLFNDKEWSNKFISTDGVKYLFSILMKKSTNDLKSLHSLKFLNLLLKLICFYLSRVTLSHIFDGKSNDFINEVCYTLLNFIYSVCEFSLIREQRKNNDQDNVNNNQQQMIRTIGPNQETIRIPENFYYESEIIYFSQMLLLSLVETDNKLLNLIYKYSNLEKMLRIGLIQTNNPYLKDRLSNGLLNLFLKFDNHDNIQRPHQLFISILLQKLLEDALLHQERSDIYFRLISTTINKLDIGEIDKNSLDVDSLLTRLTEFVKQRKPMEKEQREVDNVLSGMLEVLRAFFNRYPEKTYKYGQNFGLIKEVFKNCLFEIPNNLNKNDISGPKCKSFTSRHGAFKLLLALIKSCEDNLEELISYIFPIHINGKWRTKRISDWYISAKDNEKSCTGYVGLKNLGCICYMNSTLQQLYMLPAFRKAIMEVPDLNFKTTPKEDNILYQLKCIFYALSESQKQYFNPKGFCHAFKDYEGNPTNVFEQMDADEFFNMFMDRLENLIKGTKQENLIKQHFGGILSNELICKGCPHYSEREEPYLTVNLQVKNKKSILQSLSSFVEGEMLEGDNAYHCAECNKKVNTLKRACLKKLPNHLIMVLKRFEFDYDTMTKVKVNDYCEFPSKLNLEPYTQQGLRKAEQQKKQASASDNKENDSDDKEKNNMTNNNNNNNTVNEYPPSYFEYKLAGIVIHLGVADSGHYYSIIQDREKEDMSEDKKWYEFNDTIVKYFDAKDIPNEAYGGEEKWRYYQVADNSLNMLPSFKEKIKNAYLLFYDRIIPYEEEDNKPSSPAKSGSTTNAKTTKEELKEDAQDIKGDKQKVIKNIKKDENVLDIKSKTDVEPAITTIIPEEFLKNLREANQKYHIHKNVFNKEKEYFEFVSDLFLQRTFKPNMIDHENLYKINKKLYPKEYYDLNVIKMIITFLLTTVLREKTRYGIVKLLPEIKQAISQNIPACRWIIDIFTSRKILVEFLLDCPISDMRKFVIGIIMIAAKRIYEIEGKGANNRLFEKDDKTGMPTTQLANFINSCINLIFESKQGVRDYSDFFKIFYELAKLGHETAGYLIHHKVVGRIMDFFYENYSPLNEYFRNMNDVPYCEPENLIGYYHEEKKKIRTVLEELLLKRKEKNMPEHHLAHRAFLWQTVSYLILYCKISKNSKRNKLQIGDYDYEITSEEKTLLTPDTVFIMKVIEDATSKIAYRSIARLYAYLAYEDAKFTNILLNAIKQGLSEKDHSIFKPYFRCFYEALQIKDSLQDQRNNELCSLYSRIMTENSNFYMETDMMSTFFLKMINRVEHFKNWFAKNSDSWTWLIDWLNQNQSPPLGISQVKLQKKRSGMPSWRFSVQDYKLYTIIKSQKLKKFAKNELEINGNDWDSDDDLAEHNFYAGEKVDYYDPHTSKWVTAEIYSTLEEMINITYTIDEKDPNSLWLSKDAEGLAPHHRMQLLQEQMEKERVEMKNITLASSNNNNNSNNNNMGNNNDQDTDPEIDYHKAGSDQSDSSDN